MNADFDFFTTGGGNSLQAAQIAWELEKSLELGEGALSLGMLYKHPKLGEFVEAVGRLKNAAKFGEKLANSKGQNEGGNVEEKALANSSSEADEEYALAKSTPFYGQNEQILPHPKLSLFPLFLPLMPPNVCPLRLHVFCIHPISGSALLYRHLAQAFPEWANVVGVQFAREMPEIEGTTNLGELAQIYAEKVPNGF